MKKDMEIKGDKKQYSWYIVIGIIVVYFSSVLISQQFHLNQIAEDQLSADTRLEIAKREHEELLKERALLEDREYIEKIAREELGMVKAGEVPYSLVKKDR